MEKKVLMFAAVGGFIGAVVSSILPSLPTTYWMWHEREGYRWVLVLSWILVAIILAAVFLYFRSA